MADRITAARKAELRALGFEVTTYIMGSSAWLPNGDQLAAVFDERSAWDEIEAYLEGDT